MQKSLKKPSFAIHFATQLVIASSLLLGATADAAPRCSLRDLFIPPAPAVRAAAERPSAEARRSENSFSINHLTSVDQITLKESTIAKVREALQRKGYEMRGNDLKSAVESAASAIKGRTRTPSVERANKMAEIGREILEAAKSDLTTKAKKNAATYLVAESVLRMETFSTTEFKTGREQDVFKKKSTLHINKFHDLVESYVDGTEGYRDLPQDGGFLQWPEIRGLYTNNSWSIGLRDHDMYHLHYSYGHPYYLAINLHSSRSINDRRYLMVSALWEAVDTFTTGYESNIASYFRKKRMSAEEGMLFLGSATEKELDAVANEIGSHTEVSSYSELSYSQGWRPIKTKFGRGNLNYDSNTLLKEVSDYINESFRRLALPNHKKYGNYHRQGPGVATGRDDNTIPGYDY